MMTSIAWSDWQLIHWVV